MTNLEIFKKAIEKAVKNGYELPPYPCTGCQTCFGHEWTEYLDSDYPHMEYAVIFSHDFAKAFWGDEYVCKNGHPIGYAGNEKECGCMIRDEKDYICGKAEQEWRYHLKEMVLEKNPIQYLANFIKE